MLPKMFSNDDTLGRFVMAKSGKQGIAMFLKLPENWK